MFYIRDVIGKNMEEFKIYKFRTMVKDADKMLENVSEQGLDSLGKPVEDPRITNVGRFLRRYWLDELPQFYNLAKGDLKLVGVRPKSRKDWKYYPEDIMYRSLEQKPGLLGVNYAYPYEDSFEKHLEVLRHYLDSYERDPVGTDSRYLVNIVSNIVAGKVRSK